MNRILQYLVLFGLLLGVTAVSAQSFVNFRSFRETKGIATNKSKGVYVWGAWEPSSVTFTLDMDKKQILLNDQSNKKTTKFQLFNKPEKWIVKKDYKYINFECMEAGSLENYNVRLFEYDSGEWRITVMAPNNAVRYSVLQMKEDEALNFDDVASED